MSKNQQVIESLEALELKVASHMQYIHNNIRKTFSMDELIIDGESNITYEGRLFTKKAKSDLLAQFKAKGDFISENNKSVIGDDNMNTIIELLSTIPMRGKAFLEFDNYDAPSMVDAVWVSKDFIDESKLPTYTQFFNRLKFNLTETDVEFEIHESRFDTDKAEVRISLYTTDTFKDNSTDGINWHNGVCIVFNLFGVTICPYYVKSTDLSGVTSKTGTSSINIKNKHYNVDRLDSIIGKYILNKYYKEFQTGFLELLEKSKTTNLSVLEYFSVVNSFSEDEFDANKELREKFSIDYLMKVYNTNVVNQNKKWKSTANSNKTVYEAFDDLIWVASRCTEFGIDSSKGDTLKNKAFNLLNKFDFDLENLAPVVTF